MVIPTGWACGRRAAGLLLGGQPALAGNGLGPPSYDPACDQSTLAVVRTVAGSSSRRKIAREYGVR